MTTHTMHTATRHGRPRHGGVPCLVAFVAMAAFGLSASAQGRFLLQQRSDTASVLLLQTPHATDTWALPYPTFAFCTGDVDGDGTTDALVGVVKPTRFDPRRARRLFAFRQVRGRVRPLWLGSRLAGELRDFRLQGSKVVTLEQGRDSTWLVGEYEWNGCGFTMTASRTHHATRDEAARIWANE